MRRDQCQQLDLIAETSVLAEIGAAVADILQAESPTFVYEAQLAVHEICTNVIQHAYGGDAGRFTLRLKADADGFTVRIEDDGIAFDPAAVSEPDLDVGQEHGYGLFLVRALTDELHYAPGGLHRRNVWHLAKRWPLPSGG